MSRPARPSIGAHAVVGGLASFGLFLLAVGLGDAGAHTLAGWIANLVVPAFFVVSIGSYLLVELLVFLGRDVKGADE